MSHPVQGEHSKVMQHLVEGKVFNIKGYSHVVCVRQDKKQSWIDKGYEAIEVSADAVMVGKKKEEEKQPVNA